MKRWILCVWLVVFFVSSCSEPPRQATGESGQAAPSDPLPSWNEGPAKKAIRDFVARVTKEGSADFVPLPERIATFDNDGTLWAEKPLPFQLFFVIDRVKDLAPQHPES